MIAYFSDGCQGKLCIELLIKLVPICRNARKKRCARELFSLEARGRDGCLLQIFATALKSWIAKAC